MRSVYLKTMMLAAAVLVACLLVFALIGRHRAYSMWREDETLGEMLSAQFDRAILEYERGGAPSLSSYLTYLATTYPKNQYQFLADGKDPLTGSELSALRRMADSWREKLHLGAPIVIGRSSADGRYVFLFRLPEFHSNLPTYAMYYAVLLSAVAILCWVLVFQFAAPLNELVEVVRRFGNGQLTARVKFLRDDGIGDMGRAFNQMAGRIEKLLAAERQLLQDISHELRSPLARLSVAAELTRKEEDRDAAVAQIHKEVERLTELLESLIQITRAERGTGTQVFSDVPLDDLVREVIEDCAIEATARGCQLQLNGLTGLTLSADRELLRRAIENLLRNAIRYSLPGGKIEIDIRGTESNASITVRDYGPGVPAAALTHIFDPFFRVDGSRDMETGGMGLGLSITQRALHLHHGQVSAENANPGLRVHVHLPLKTPQAALQN